MSGRFRIEHFSSENKNGLGLDSKRKKLTNNETPLSLAADGERSCFVEQWTNILI